MSLTLRRPPGASAGFLRRDRTGRMPGCSGHQVVAGEDEASGSDSGMVSGRKDMVAVDANETLARVPQNVLDFSVVNRGKLKRETLSYRVGLERCGSRGREIVDASMTWRVRRR